MENTISEWSEQITAINSSATWGFNESLTSIEMWNYSSQLRELKEALEKQDNFSWKTIICFVWAPWAWKSTQINLLKERINPQTFHMSGFVKSLGKRDIVNSLNSKWQLIAWYENEFLDSVADTTNAFNILDGFPRSEEQTILLYRKALEEWWEVKTICLDFPENELSEQSLLRQNSRAVEEGKNETDERREGKLNRYFQQDKKAINAIGNITPQNIALINANSDIETVTQLIETELWIDILSEKFSWDILWKVALAEQETWVEMWLGAGLIYREYFNGKYWPIRDSFDKDIHIEKTNEIRKSLESLQAVDWSTRWAVDSRFQDTEEFYWIDSKSMQEAMTTFPLTFRQVGTRLNKDWKLSIAMSQQAKYDLENGIIRIDENLLLKIWEKEKQSFLSRAVSRAHKTLQEYPWLKLEWLIKKLYKEKYWEHNLVAVDPNIWWIIEWISDIEYGGKQIWRAPTINGEQKLLMEEVVEFYTNTKPLLQKVKYPNKWEFHSPLNRMLELKQKKERWEILSTEEEELLQSIHIEEWFESQLDFNSTLIDSEFNEWFLNQIRSRKPFWGKDIFVNKILWYMKENSSKEQKPTHLWLPLHIHSIDAVSQLTTDKLISNLSDEWYSDEKITSVRKSMRIAMLMHDIWKIKNSLTPWCHEWVGVKIWEKLTPEWISEDEKNIISWIIWVHDVFWRLARSITEKEWQKLADTHFDVLSDSSYKWSIDPKEASDMINKSPLNNDIAFSVAKEIWKADVNSVSSLSWILWISESLFKIVEIEISK